MNAYFYTPKYRPPGAFTVPADWDLVERGANFDPPGRRDLPLGRYPFGVIRYRWPLSAEECEAYELERIV